jgi:hypothetical protein
MARGLSYRDAAVLLGGGPETKVVAALDKLVGGVLLVATAGGSGFALSLFDAKAELFKLCTDLIGGLGERVRGLNRYDRTRRLEAAHAVAVMAAFFEVVARLELPRELLPTKGEQLRLVSGRTEQDLAAALLEFTPPLPTPHVPYEQRAEDLRTCYHNMTNMLAGFETGLASWARLSQAEVDRHDAELATVPGRAVERYGVLFRRLALEFPEFGYWANMLDHQATRAEVRRLDTALAGLAASLYDLRIGRDPAGVRIDLTTKYQAVLRRPALTFSDDEQELSAPTIERCYVNPHFRVGQPRLDEITRTDWWDAQPLRTDLQDLLVGHLTSPIATAAPLVVLGHPGAGKSLLTHMLAARLPASDFLAVRVPLRDVPADADLQTQIELAIRADTGIDVNWPTLAAAAGDALPVILLDGFDELLQATGQSQSNYLERITAFQQREADLGRPVAVLVTSRLTVADRARPVFGVVTLLLEPFDDDQVALWLDAWNQCNAAVLASRGLRPLTAETALCYRNVARQPLLLLLLALYDADSNALHDETRRLGEAEVYEELLSGFTRREVLKSGQSLTDRQIAEAVAREMLQLSVVAFAMFNRNQLWVSESELDVDLRVLLGQPDTPDSTRLTAAELLVGRFYFVHVAQAVHDQKRLKTYEFLHATFGEFLVARLTVHELDNLLAASQLPATWGRARPPDDQFLHALLSYAPLTMRLTVVLFVIKMVERRPDADRLGGLLLDLFRTSLHARHPTPLDEYRPMRMTVPARAATYSANLFLLAAVTLREVTSTELFPGVADHAIEWTRTAQLWQSQLPAEGWRNLVAQFTVTREWDDSTRLIRISRPVEDVAPIDPNWTYGYPPVPADSYAFYRSDEKSLFAEVSFAGGRLQETAIHTLEPFAGSLGTMLTTFHRAGGRGMVSAARALISLWLTSTLGLDPSALAEEFAICLRIATNGFHPEDDPTRNVFRSLVLRQLNADFGELSEEWLRATLDAVDGETASDNKEGKRYLDQVRRSFDL